MTNYLYLLFAQKRFFWTLKDFISRMIFKVKVKIFNTRKEVSEGNKSYSYFQQIISVTQTPIFIALIVAIILQLTNSPIKPFLKNIKQFIDENLFIVFGSINDGDYVSLLIGMAAIGGVFIGLHYAGLSTLNGSIYAKYPNNIRNLLNEERFGKIYINFLAFFTYLALILVSFRVVGFEKIYLMPFMMILGIGIGIYAFIHIGKNLFSLFDPTKLSVFLLDDILNISKKIYAGELYSSDKSFQQHHHNLAKDKIDTLISLFELSKNESHLSGKPLIDLSKNLLNFLQSYQQIKQLIPTDSLWFTQKYIHPDWYKIDESKANIHYSTATMPDPDVIYEYLWIEKKILPLIIDAIKINFENSRFDIVSGLLTTFSSYLDFMANDTEVKFAQNRIKKLQKEIIDVIKTKDFNYKQLEVLGIVETIMNMSIQHLISFYNSISQYSYEDVSEKVANINWSDKTDIYKHNLKTYNLNTLEEMSKKLLYEKQIENWIVTPHWYQIEIVMLNVSNRFLTNVETLIKTFEIYDTALEELNDIKFSYLKGIILTNKLKYLNRFEYQFSKIKSLCEAYINNRKIDDLQWKKFNVDEINTQLNAINKKLLIEVSKQTLEDSFFERPKDYPDFFGQFLHITGEAIIDSFCNNDIDLFNQLFPEYFIGSMLKFNKLRPTTELSEWRMNIEMKFATSPIMDLLAISGYAKLFSEFLDNNELWEKVKESWDTYLESEENIKPEFFVLLINLSESSYGIGHRSMNRMNWQNKVEYKLNKLPKKNIYNRNRGAFSIPSPRVLVNHKSALVRLFSKEENYSNYDGIDIFIENYLKTLDIPDTYKYGMRDRKDLKRAIDSEKKFYEKHKEEL